MNETTAIIAPAFLLMIVVAGYMFTIFEPYLALRFRSAEVVELLDYHAKDLKLQRIAEWLRVVAGTTIVMYWLAD
jgi:hypothetical protein